jgi:hypothetical protein
MPGSLQRLHHLPSDTLVYDLQYRLRCIKCRADRGLEIIIQDMREISYRAGKPLSIMVVEELIATMNRRIPPPV